MATATTRQTRRAPSAGKSAGIAIPTIASPIVTDETYRPLIAKRLEAHNLCCADARRCDAAVVVARAARDTRGFPSKKKAYETAEAAHEKSHAAFRDADRELIDLLIQDVGSLPAQRAVDGITLTARRLEFGLKELPFISLDVTPYRAAPHA